jgi:hypothetical protein
MRFGENLKFLAHSLSVSTVDDFMAARRDLHRPMKPQLMAWESGARFLSLDVVPRTPFRKVMLNTKRRWLARS